MEKKMTNYEKIKNMSIEEMATFFGAGMGKGISQACSSEHCLYYKDTMCEGKGPDRCISAYKSWLESEAKVVEDE